jgi:hypothetical protein
MFLRATLRKKDGKKHHYWSIVENRRVGRRARQRHVLYLGEINASQDLAWRKSIEVSDEAPTSRGHSRCFRKIAARGLDKFGAARTGLLRHLVITWRQGSGDDPC